MHPFLRPGQQFSVSVRSACLEVFFFDFAFLRSFRLISTELSFYVPYVLTSCVSSRPTIVPGKVYWFSDVYFAHSKTNPARRPYCWLTYERWNDFFLRVDSILRKISAKFVVVLCMKDSFSWTLYVRQKYAYCGNVLAGWKIFMQILLYSSAFSSV